MARPKKEQVVQVVLADGVTEMGLGKIVGHTTIYFFEMPDGSMHLWQDDEVDLADTSDWIPHPPPKEWVDYLDKLGVHLVPMPDTAIILLENDRVVYGFQVMYIPVQEGRQI